MEIQGEKLLALPRIDVWRALNDPAVLRRCLPGCDTFDADGENQYRVAMQAAVGPVRARFAGKLQMRDVVVPTSYALAFEGSGGVAGFGKGTAQVVLADDAGGTRLRYNAQAQVGGRLAQVGARLIDGVTKRMADDFFSRFVKELTTHDSPVRDGGRQQKDTVVALQAATVVEPTTAEVLLSSQNTRIAVIAAAVSATAASVAVLAATFVVHFAR